MVIRMIDNGDVLDAGDVLDVPDWMARTLVEDGAAEALVTLPPRPPHPAEIFDPSALRCGRA